MTAALKAFLQTVAAQAAQLPGRPPVLIVVRDPVDRQVHFVGTPGAFVNMQPEIAQKAGVGGEDEAVAAWPE